MSILRRMVAAALVSTTLAGVARAQTIHGTVVDPTTRPLFGVVVLLVDSTSQVVGRTLTSERGDFRVSAQRPGTYRIRTLRIGFKPVVSDPIALPLGSDVTHDITLSSVALGLDTMRVAGQNVCRAFTDSGAATYAVWEQIRAALTAAELTANARSIQATTVVYERSIDPKSGRRVLRQQASVSTDYVKHPWLSLAPDNLRRQGYVVTDRDNSVVYYAPGLDMLLSPIFVADHCVKLVTDSKRPAQLGIEFEPIPERKRGPAEIRGTMWVDRPTSELRELEFKYVNVSPDQASIAGGTVQFARMRDGAWAISRWDIRMPVIEQFVIPGHGTELRVTEIRVNGGQLALARRLNDTLWAGPRITMHGSLVDSASGTPLREARIAVGSSTAVTDNRGRFEIAGVLPGPYTAEVRTASLDSMNAVHRSPVTIIDSTTQVDIKVPSAQQLAAALCGAPANGSGGIVTGSLHVKGAGDARAVLRGARIRAEWADPSDTTHVRRVETGSTPDGAFRVCGLPLDTAVSFRAASDSAESPEATVVRLAPGARVTRTDLTMERNADVAARGATFIGIVVSDSSKLPIVGAEVAFPELGKSVVTDVTGAFRVLGISAGDQHLIVRRLGFGAADARVSFNGHETVERRIVLGKAIELSPMVVSERETDRTMPGFEENRRLGLGHFLTRVELEKYTGMKLGTALQQVVGFGMADGHGQYPSSRFGPMCPSASCYTPSTFELQQGIRTACYAQVYLDGTLMNGAKQPTEPFDISTIAPERIEAIEYYASGAQTPLKYSRMGSACGVLVIWTRRR